MKIISRWTKANHKDGHILGVQRPDVTGVSKLYGIDTMSYGVAIKLDMLVNSDNDCIGHLTLRMDADEADWLAKSLSAAAALNRSSQSPAAAFR